MDNKRTGPDYLDMTDAEFKKLNKAMHKTAKSGGAASQEIQNKYALELARRRRNNKDGTYTVTTNPKKRKK